MSAESILVDAILVAGGIVILTGTLTVAGLLRIARGGGIRQAPSFSMPGVTDRDRILRARLRARYHGRSHADRVAVYRPLAKPVPSVKAHEPPAVGMRPAPLSADAANPSVAA
jgi:hypothetical protein